jgi:hypothetical protein
MLANNTILTSDTNSYEIRQFYYAPRVILPPDNIELHSLYSFVSYQPEWNEIVFSSNVAETIVIHDAAIFKSSNALSILNAPTLNDFREDQLVIGDVLPENTKISSIDEDNFILYLDKNATDNYIGKVRFKGFIENDNKVTLHDQENKLDGIDYTTCALKVDVTNETGGLIYYKNIINYNPETKTVVADSFFNDAPPISANSSVSIVYDNIHPPLPKDTIKYKKDLHKNIIFMKKITPNNMSPVVKRINWTQGEVYDYYRDDIDLYEKEEDGTPKYYFYAMNQYYQVFKCLWNNNGGPATSEPYFVAGNFDDVTNIFYDPDDGYKWKYLFTVPYRNLQKFMDENWIPVPVNDLFDVTASSQKQGGIEAINITNPGENYDSSNAVVSVAITGDGYGAAASVEVDQETKTIENIVIRSVGYGYTYANVSIISSQGSNASAFASISPIGGNGSDILSELGCDRIMITCLFEGSEGGKFPTDIKIRQFGLIVNPDSNSTYPYIANSESYSTTNDIIVSNGFGSFTDGEIVYQTKNNANIANAVFTSTCVKYDPASNRLKLANVVGGIVTGNPVYGYSSGTSRTLLQKIDPDIIRYSGNIIYIENRETIQRSSDGMELIRVVLKF